MITAFVLIRAEPNSIADLAPAIAELDGVAEVHSVAGGETDLVATLRVPDHESIARAVTDGIAKQAGVSSTSTLIAFRRYSSEQIDAAYEGFGD